MMAVLLLVEMRNGALVSDATAKAVAAARPLGEVTALVAGTGAGDAAARSQFALANSRYINTDPLAQSGDWAKYFNKGGDDDVPFTAITGQRSGSTNGEDNEFAPGTEHVVHLRPLRGRVVAPRYVFGREPVSVPSVPSPRT